MFRHLEYQSRVMATMGSYIDILKEKKREADKAAEIVANTPDVTLRAPDFTKEAWDQLLADGALPVSRREHPFTPREDGCGNPVPNIVLKVPTAGGKTWLAISGVSSVLGRYLERNIGFVLWVVPNEAIYTQTRRNLKDRQHPYRQALDRAAAGRVRIMEKGDRLNAQDVESSLCIMLLMLQSARRREKDTLKIFQDRGDVHGFFPPEGNQAAHEAMLAKTPNLDAYQGMLTMVKDSLGNALRVIRPVVVLDEGHMAISPLALDTLYGFNPCFVLELTATPKDVRPRAGRNPRPACYANVLVEVSGREVDREGMIKMPINLNPRQGNDWRATLNAAMGKLGQIETAAKQFRADSNRYIRPIMLIQVERTGAEQRESGYIHVEDVRETLLRAGFDEAEIAIKTAERNDLNQPENQDLLSPTNRVRAIITKKALQEGWDCPFAYVLCSLAASANQSDMTQLIGRIMRQPYAMKTGIDILDECHVVTHHAETGVVVSTIKKGLEREGLGDLELQIHQEDVAGNDQESRSIARRHKFETTDIYLPYVMFSESKNVRGLDYETDVLAQIDWRGYVPENTINAIPPNAQAADSQLQRIRINHNRDGELDATTITGNDETSFFDTSHAARMLLDIVPNSFIAWEIVERMLNGLHKRGFDDGKIGKLAGLVLDELRKDLESERNQQAENIFRSGVENGDIQFRLRVDGNNWRMPSRIDASFPENSRQLLSNTGYPLQRSLFSPIYEEEMNNDEREVAVYLDGDEAVAWWHRNVARKQYGVQGWRKARIYPDFIFAVHGNGTPQRIAVLETKGDQIDNLDADYKRKVLSLLSDAFNWDDATPVGELELVRNTGETVECELILMSEWKTRLPGLITPSHDSP